jgi:uncharacterized protein (TIRG00374 family)
VVCDLRDQIWQNSFFMNNYRYLTYSIVLTILGLGVWIAFVDYEKILLSIQSVGLHGFLFVCAFSLVNYICRYIRWTLLLRQLGDRFAFVDGLICYFAGFALTTTPGKAGEAIRSVYFYRRHQIHHGHTLAALLSERASDALASVLLATLAIYTFENMRWLGAGFTAAIFLVVLLVSKPALLLKTCAWLRVIKVQLVQKFLDLIPVFLARAAELFSARAMTVGILIGLVSWSAEAFAFAWLAHQLGGQASMLLYMSIFAIAMVAGAATFLPGGLGGTEAVMFLLLKMTGMGDAEAFTAFFLCRLATLWLAVVLGLVSMLWLENNPAELQSE